MSLLTNQMDLESLITWISVGTIVAIVIILILLSVMSKKLPTRTLVFAGVTAALSFCLSFIKVTPVTYGGSITLASLLPIMFFAYAYGFFPALLVGVAYGLLQFVQDPYVLTPTTFLLDYVIAFSCICIVPLFKIEKFSKTMQLFLGVTMAYLFRFTSHLFSGIIYFNLGAVWAELPASTAFTYSALYQIVYIIPDYIITLFAFIALAKTGVFETLEKLAVNKKASQ